MGCLSFRSTKLSICPTLAIILTLLLFNVTEGVLFMRRQKQDYVDGPFLILVAWVSILEPINVTYWFLILQSFGVSFINDVFLDVLLWAMEYGCVPWRRQVLRRHVIHFHWASNVASLFLFLELKERVEFWKLIVRGDDLMHIFVCHTTHLS